MRSREPVLLAACLAIACGGAGAAPPAVHPGPVVFAADAKVAGRRVDAYPALWWQWINRKQRGAPAFQDPTGAQCALNQSGPVWFLAGTDGSSEARRHCRIPEGKHIFLPMIAMLANAEPGQPRACAEVKAAVASNNEHFVPGQVSLDGIAIDARPLRMASACFNAYDRTADHDITAGYFPAATDGYWLMLAPLPVGRHVLKVDVRYDNRGADLGDLEQVFQYDLDVGGPEPSREERQAEPDDDWRQAAVHSSPGGHTAT